MLELPYIRDNRNKVVEGLQKRNIKDADSQIDEIIQTDTDRKSTQGNLDSLLSEANSLSKSIGQLMKEGKKSEAEAIKEKSHSLKAQSKELSEKLQSLESKLTSLLYNIPNIPNDRVPKGTSADDNVEVLTWGQKPVLPEGAQPHWDLIKQYDIIDFELGNKIAGAGFPVYKGKGARLQRAMINFFLEEAR
ncbi:MAG: serine--tRNA ligase, partial [Cyclobacteriaceae bacterium]|nr:serine--tRNA ligase [Cyclobacteriaceae bacterium]